MEDTSGPIPHPSRKTILLQTNVANMDSPESYDNVASCDKLLESMQSLRPLLHGANNDFFHSFQLMAGSGSAFSTSMSTAMDRSPTTMSGEDLEILDSPAMLNNYEQDMLLSGLGTSSSISGDELSTHMEHTEKWNVSADGWKVNHGFANGDHGELVTPHVTGTVKDSAKVTRPEAERVERKTWGQHAGKPTERKQNAESTQRPRFGAKWGASASHSSPRQGFSRVNSSTELYKQLDSSDNSDGMEDMDEVVKRGRSKAPMSKNLVSERRRRKKLNERLYSLRALVPKISKMDKASIVGDAIDYVRDLQKQVEEMQEDVANLEASKEAVAGGTDFTKNPKLVSSLYPRKKALQEHRIVELEVTQMEEQTYHLRIHCKKTPGVLVQLTRALEALEFEIVNANLTSVNDHILNTIVVEVKNGVDLKTEELRKMTLDIIPRFGLSM